VLDADHRERDFDSLWITGASVMPAIPSGNTYLGSVMVAEQIAKEMKRAVGN